MTCPSLDVCAAYADGQLEAPALQNFEDHLESCTHCRQRVGILAAESRALRAAFEADALSAPRIESTASSGAATYAWLGWLFAAIAPLNAAWLSAVAALRLPGWLSWMVPDAASLGAEIAVDAAVEALLPNWSLMNMLLHPIVITTLIAVTGVLLFWRQRRSTTGTQLTVALLAGTLLLASHPADAFELKRSEGRIVIAADETIEDTVALIGDSILVEGTINGDLLAIADRVVLNGVVTGMVVTFGDEIDITGRIDGNLIQAGDRSVLNGAVIGGNWLGAGDTLAFTRDSSVAGNAAVAGDRVEIDGSIARDLFAAAEGLSLTGTVTRHVRGVAGRVTLTAGTTIGGDLKLQADPEQVQGADSASVGGTVDINRAKTEERSRMGAESILFQVLKLLAALLCGWLLFRVAPSLARLGAGTGSEGLLTLAIGFAVLIGMPLAAIIITITLIGAPIGIALFLLWVAACYLAGIIAARWAGAQLLSSDRYGLVLQLLTGLLVIAVLSAIPILGSAVSAVTTLLGLGLLGRWIYEGRGAII